MATHCGSTQWLHTVATSCGYTQWLHSLEQFVISCACNLGEALSSVNVYWGARDVAIRAGATLFGKAADRDPIIRPSPAGFSSSLDQTRDSQLIPCRQTVKHPGVTIDSRLVVFEAHMPCRQQTPQYAAVC